MKTRRPEEIRFEIKKLQEDLKVSVRTYEYIPISFSDKKKYAELDLFNDWREVDTTIHTYVMFKVAEILKKGKRVVFKDYQLGEYEVFYDLHNPKYSSVVGARTWYTKLIKEGKGNDKIPPFNDETLIYYMMSNPSDYDHDCWYSRYIINS